MSERRILMIDDDVELGQLMTDFLQREGFALTLAHTAGEGLERLRAGGHALVLLDLMLPDLDGFEVLRILRRELDCPVIMLTAKGEDVDRIVGLELGADDYLPKPFNPRELSARIKAVLRRGGAGVEQREGEGAPGGSGEPATPPIIRGGLVLDQDAHRATLDGRPLALTAIEFAMLCVLARDAGRVLSRDTLLDRVRGREFESFDRSIDVHISHLRAKLGDDPQHPRYIRTVRSVGYMFIAGVE